MKNIIFLFLSKYLTEPLFVVVLNIWKGQEDFYFKSTFIQFLFS